MNRHTFVLFRQVLADAQAALNAANTEVERAEAQIAIEVNLLVDFYLKCCNKCSFYQINILSPEFFPFLLRFLRISFIFIKHLHLLL